MIVFSDKAISLFAIVFGVGAGLIAAATSAFLSDSLPIIVLTFVATFGFVMYTSFHREITVHNAIMLNIIAGALAMSLAFLGIPGHMFFGYVVGLALAMAAPLLADSD
jgi:hypothetical protein